MIFALQAAGNEIEIIHFLNNSLGENVYCTVWIFHSIHNVSDHSIKLRLVQGVSIIGTHTHTCSSIWTVWIWLKVEIDACSHKCHSMVSDVRHFRSRSVFYCFYFSCDFNFVKTVDCDDDVDGNQRLWCTCPSCVYSSISAGRRVRYGPVDYHRTLDILCIVVSFFMRG